MKMDDCGESVGRVQSFRMDLNTIDNKIDDVFNRLYSQYICLLSDPEAKEKESLRSFHQEREVKNLKYSSNAVQQN